ncbi:MAG: sulfite exporter TauE/SafE family protein [Bacteroidia bacterium]
MFTEIAILCFVSFIAGFIDSIVGGGGLVQTPAMLVLLPQFPVATILGTSKIPSVMGTAFAAYKYSREIDLDWKLLINIAIIAFLGAVLGSHCTTLINGNIIKPVILVILILVAIYTYTRKSFGLHEEKNQTFIEQLSIGFVFGGVIGFYDGLIGPGTGTFFIMCFITLLGKDFLHASAHAKCVNVGTNLASILYFSSTGHILYKVALPMAVFNLFGSYLGTKLALLKGNKFVRLFFLVVVFGTILRFAWELIVKRG